MDNSLLVRFVHGRTNLLEDIGNPFERQTLLFGKYISERTPVEILHYEIGHLALFHPGETKVGYVNYVRMA